jgi:hypothetical protein
MDGNLFDSSETLVTPVYSLNDKFSHVEKLYWQHIPELIQLILDFLYLHTSES